MSIYKYVTMSAICSVMSAYTNHSNSGQKIERAQNDKYVITINREIINSAPLNLFEYDVIIKIDNCDADKQDWKICRSGKAEFGGYAETIGSICDILNRSGINNAISKSRSLSELYPDREDYRQHFIGKLIWKIKKIEAIGIPEQVLKQRDLEIYKEYSDNVKKYFINDGWTLSGLYPDMIFGARPIGLNSEIVKKTYGDVNGTIYEYAIMNANLAFAWHYIEHFNNYTPVSITQIEGMLSNIDQSVPEYNQFSFTHFIRIFQKNKNTEYIDALHKMLDTHWNGMISKSLANIDPNTSKSQVDALVFCVNTLLEKGNIKNLIEIKKNTSTEWSKVIDKAMIDGYRHFKLPKSDIDMALMSQCDETTSVADSVFPFDIVAKYNTSKSSKSIMKKLKIALIKNKFLVKFVEDANIDAESVIIESSNKKIIIHDGINTDNDISTILQLLGNSILVRLESSAMSETQFIQSKIAKQYIMLSNSSIDIQEFYKKYSINALESICKMISLGDKINNKWYFGGLFHGVINENNDNIIDCGRDILLKTIKSIKYFPVNVWMWELAYDNCKTQDETELVNDLLVKIFSSEGNIQSIQLVSNIIKMAINKLGWERLKNPIELIWAEYWESLIKTDKNSETRKHPCRDILSIYLEHLKHSGLASKYNSVLLDIKSVYTPEL